MHRSAFERPSIRTVSRIAGALAALVIASCGSNQPSTAPPAVGETVPEEGQRVTGQTSPASPMPTRVAGPPTATGAERPCPMQVEGVTVEASDIAGGAALTFVTTGDVQDLRQRVGQMAEMHQQRHGGASGGGMGMGHTAVQTRVEPVEGGARLIILAEDPKEVAQVQQHARMMAGHMERGQCPMMQDHGMTGGQR